MVWLCVGAGRNVGASCITTLRFVLSCSVLCLLIFEHYYSAFVLGFPVYVGIICANPGTETLDDVSRVSTLC